jgi:hypothetical protein
VLAFAVLALGILWNPLAVASDRGVSRFQSLPGGRPAAVVLTQEGARP